MCVLCAFFDYRVLYTDVDHLSSTSFYRLLVSPVRKRKDFTILSNGKIVFYFSTTRKKRILTKSQPWVFLQFRPQHSYKK